jgi:hypothetical protein
MHRRRAVRSALAPLALLALLGLLAPIGCEGGSDCAETCKRVATCRLARAQGGERMLGEGKAAPDPTCMDRCAAQKPEFTSCEAKRRDCAGILDCIPYR